MPFSDTRIFLEETSLVARPAVPFEELKQVLHSICRHIHSGSGPGPGFNGLRRLRSTMSIASQLPRAVLFKQAVVSVLW
jgi:hypothetical protein